MKRVTLFSILAGSNLGFMCNKLGLYFDNFAMYAFMGCGAWLFHSLWKGLND